MSPSDQSRMIEQANFTYSLPRITEHYIIMIENQGEKQTKFKPVKVMFLLFQKVQNHFDFFVLLFHMY